MMIDHVLAGLHGRGIDIGEVVAVSKGARLCPVNDPYNNTITFIESFRDQY